MDYAQVFIWLYLGGVLGAAVRELQNWFRMGDKEWRRWVDIGGRWRPVLSLVLQAGLWPVFGLVTILLLAQDPPRWRS